jgi:hypothetical protein
LIQTHLSSVSIYNQASDTHEEKLLLKREVLNVPAGEPKVPVFVVFVLAFVLAPKRPPPPELLFWPKADVVFAPKPGSVNVSTLGARRHRQCELTRGIIVVLPEPTEPRGLVVVRG